MGEKTEDNKISVKVGSKKFVSCNVYTLKVPNFFTLPEYEGNFEIDSASFEFENATWCFRCCRSPLNLNKNFDIDILRLKTEIPEHILYFKAALLNDNNVQNYSGYEMIEESCKPCGLNTFNEDGSFLDPCDTLTIIVHLFTFETTEIDAIKSSSKADSPLNNMAVEIKDCKLTLELTKKTVSSDFYTVQLPNVFAAPKKDFDTSSPFNFSNTTCCFYFESDWNLSVSLEALNVEKPLGNIFIKSILIDTHGKIIGRYFEKHDFTELSQKIKVAWFHSVKPISTLHFYIIREEELEVCEEVIPIVRARDFDSLFLDLKKLFLDGKNSDLTLKVAEKEFRVHSSILMARSPVFEAMLSFDMIEKNKGIIEVPDIDAQAMELLLTFIYSGEVDSLNEDNVLGVYYAADKYNMVFLKKECSEFMKKSLSPSIICDAIQLALNHNDTDLLECCKKYFVNHISDILPTVEWMSFMKSNTIVANELLIKTSKKWDCSKS